MPDTSDNMSSIDSRIPDYSSKLWRKVHEFSCVVVRIVKSVRKFHATSGKNLGNDCRTVIIQGRTRWIVAFHLHEINSLSAARNPYIGVIGNTLPENVGFTNKLSRPNLQRPNKTLKCF